MSERTDTAQCLHLRHQQLLNFRSSPPHAPSPLALYPLWPEKREEGFATV